MHPIKDQMISEESVSQRLRSMLLEVQARSADRVRSEAAIILDDMNRLGPITELSKPGMPGVTMTVNTRSQQSFEVTKIREVRSLVHEALTLFEENQQHLSEMCLARALDCWEAVGRPEKGNKPWKNC
jgi:hypothetical protein